MRQDVKVAEERAVVVEFPVELKEARNPTAFLLLNDLLHFHTLAEMKENCNRENETEVEVQMVKYDKLSDGNTY